MNSRIILLGLILAFLLVPAGAVTVSLSSGGGSPDTPTENVSVFIGEAKTAVNERNWTSALFLTTRGLAYYPDNPELLGMQGYTYRKLGQYQKSVDEVSRAIALDPKAVRYANRGYGYLAMKNYAAALADADAGISLDPSYSTTYCVKALALRGLGRNPEALAAIGQALSLEPENPHYRHVDGLLLASAGNCTGAREALEKSVALDPGYNLPYPGFGSAGDLLAGLNTSCIPVPLPPVRTQPAQSPAGYGALLGICGAALAAPAVRK